MTSPKAIFKRCVTYILVFNLIATQLLQAARPLHIDIVREHFDDHDRRPFSLKINDQVLNYRNSSISYKDRIQHDGKSYTLSVKPIDPHKQEKEASYQVLIKGITGGLDLNLHIGKDGLVKVNHAKTQDAFKLSTFGSLQLAPKTHHIAAAHFTAKSIYNYGRCHITRSLGLQRFDGGNVLTEEALFRNAGDAHLYCQGKLDVWGGDFENQREFTATGDLDVSLHGNAFIHTKTTQHLSRLNIHTKMNIFGASQVLLRAPVEGEDATLKVQSDSFEADIMPPSKKEAHKRARGLVAQHMDIKAKKTAISAQTNVTVGSASIAYVGKSTQDFRASEAHFDGDLLCREHLHVSLGKSAVGKGGKVHAGSMGVFGSTFENHGQVTGREAAFHLKDLFHNHGVLGAQKNLYITSDHRLFNGARAHLYGAHTSLVSAIFQNDGLILGASGAPIQKLFIQSSGAFINGGEIEAEKIHGVFQRKQAGTKAPHFKNTGKIIAKDRMILEGDAIGCNENLIKSRVLTLRGDLHLVNGKDVFDEENAAGCVRAQKTHFDLKGSFTNMGEFDSQKVTGFARKFNNLVGTSIVGNWQLHASTFKNAGLVLGAGLVRTQNYKNLGLMKGNLTLSVGSKGENKGVLELLSLIGEGHFFNVKRASLSSIHIASYVESGLLVAHEVTLGTDLKHFETRASGHLKIKRLLTESAQDKEMTFIHKGKATIEEARLLGSVLLDEASTWSGRALSWVGSLFHIQKLAALKGVKDLSLTGETKNDAKLHLKDAHVFFSNLKNDHKLEVSGQTHVKADSVSNSAQITVNQGAKVHIGALNNDKAITFKGADVRVDSLKNTGSVHAQGCGPFRILQGVNEGTLSLEGTHAQLGLNAPTYLTNQGTLLVGEGAKATLEHVDNDGLVRYTSQSAIDHFFLAHALGRKIGRLESAHLLTLNADGKNLTPFWQYVNTHQLQADLEVNAVHMVLRDAFTHALSLTLRSSRFENFSDVGAKNLSVFARRTENNGRMRAKENLTLQNVFSLGRVYAGEKLEVNGSSRDIVLQSQHLIEGAKTVSMTLGAALKNYQNLTIENLFRVTGASLSNYAHLKAGEIYAELASNFENGFQGARGVLESTKESITLLCQNAWNLWGEVRSKAKLTIHARERIESGQGVAYKPQLWIGDFYRSNESVLFAADDMDLRAGGKIVNNLGLILSLKDLYLNATSTENISGIVHSCRDTFLKGLFVHDRKVDRYYLHSPSGSEFGDHTPYKVFDLNPVTGDLGTLRALVRDSGHPLIGKQRNIKQDFLTALPSLMVVGRDLIANSGSSFKNRASHLRVGRHAKFEGHAYQDENITIHMEAESDEGHRGGGWEPIGAVSQSIMPTFSTNCSLQFNTERAFVCGVISSPYIRGIVNGAFAVQGRSDSGAALAPSSSSCMMAHMAPYVDRYQPQGALTSQSGSTDVVSLRALGEGTSLTVGRASDPHVSYEKARKALAALVHMRETGLQGQEVAPFCGPLPESYLAPLCRGALPEGFERFALPQAHPGYLYGLRFLEECVDPHVNAALLCGGGQQEHLGALFKNHLVINAVQPFLEHLWYLDMLMPMNTGYLIGGMTTHQEIAALKEVGLRFALNKGRRGILSLCEKEIEACPFPMITYKLVYKDGIHVLRPHLYVPASFLEDPVAVARRMGQAGLIADESIHLLTGTFDCSGMIAAGGDVDLKAQGDGRVRALASRHMTARGYEETRAPGSGTIASFHGAARVVAGDTLLLESSKIVAHKDVLAQGVKGTYAQPIALTSEETHGSKKNKVTVRTSSQLPAEFISKTAKVELSSPEGAVHDVGSYFSSPLLAKLYGKYGVRSAARRETREVTHTKQTGRGPVSSTSQRVTHTSAPTGADFDAPHVHMVSQDPGSIVLLESTDLSRAQKITLETPTVALTSAAHETVEQYAQTSKGVMTSTVSVGGSSQVFHVPPRLEVMPELKAPEGSDLPIQVCLRVPQESLEDKGSILARLAGTRGAVVESLKQEALTWNKTTTRLGSGVMVALGICLTMLTGGAGGSWAVAALQAADISLKLQFLDGLVANNGNPGKALLETFSAQSLKAALGSALTAGVSSSLGGVFGKIPAKGSLDLGEHFVYNLRLNLAKIPTQAIFEGKALKDILESALLGTVSGCVGTLGASHIGALVHPSDGSASGESVNAATACATPRAIFTPVLAVVLGAARSIRLLFPAALAAAQEAAAGSRSSTPATAMPVRRATSVPRWIASARPG
ncbi:MAG: DUF637 domain-containing protein [Proteobacteria bacterium]|nr:DUF637 domain-containing protein [Pseudomonadota bacterium]